jgi:uncharacterized phage protein gp47/JayE
MTFVAQNYERFADDLLTALTGGVIREEHRFTGIEESYSLSSPGAIAATVKVFGQRNDSFALFEGGIDCDYKTEEEVIAWKEKGRLPDDRSYFYVNYYLQEGRRRLTDRNPGSVTATLAEAFAREFAVLHKQMEMIYQSAFVGLATGTSLDHVAALLAIDRKDAKFAGGEALFKRNTPAEGDITIPVGTLVSTDQGLNSGPPQNFETTDKRTLRRGQLSVVVPIRAQAEGSAGRVEAGTIKNINRPIFGIESVINEAPTFFATGKETDEELRRRIKGTLERAGKSTLNAIKFSLIEEISGINEGNVQVSETSEPGKVEVKFGLGGGVKPEMVRRIEGTIFNSRAAGVRVTHNLPTSSQPTTVRPAESSVTRGKSQAAVQAPEELLKTMPEGVLDLRIEVLLRLVEPNLSASQKESIEDEVRTRVVDYIESLPMGADLIYNKLLRLVVESEEILDAILFVGTTHSGKLLFDIEPKFQGQLEDRSITEGLRQEFQKRNIALSPDVSVSVENKGSRWLITDNANKQTYLVRKEQSALKVLRGFYRSNLDTSGRKTKVEKPHEQVIVGLMDEAVFIDAQVTLEEKPQTQGAAITPLIKTAINDAIKGALAAARDKLSKTDLRSAISNAIAGSDLQFVADNAVVVNAEYEETGRLLNNTDEVPVEEHQVLNLRKADIKMKGALDG